MRRVTMFIAVAALGAAAACGDSGGPEGVPEEALTFLRQAASAPMLETFQASFWAVRGTERSFEIDYAPDQPNGVGGEFLRLVIPSNALLRRADGTPLGVGDSVLITVSIDTARIFARLEPSGLAFNPSDPAELRIRYEEADDDLDGDGAVDQADDAIKDLRLALWRQERPGAGWFQIGAVHLKDFERFEAQLLQFSNYALAW